MVNAFTIGFLLSAKEKLKPGGTVLTFIGGRIPFEITDECFRRAGLAYNVMYSSFKYQSEPMFLKQYAQVEKNEGVSFAFYAYQCALEILRRELDIEAPEIISGNAHQILPEEEMKKILEPALVNAEGAYRLYLQGKTVGHLAYAFEAFHPREQNPPRPSVDPGRPLDTRRETRPPPLKGI